MIIRQQPADCPLRLAPATEFSFTVTVTGATPTAVLIQSRTVARTVAPTLTWLGGTAWRITISGEQARLLAAALTAPAWALMATVDGDGPYPLLAGTIEVAETSAVTAGVYTVYIGTTEIQLTVE